MNFKEKASRSAAEWLHCNKCFTRTPSIVAPSPAMTRDTQTQFLLTSCGHIFCGKCFKGLFYHNFDQNLDALKKQDQCIIAFSSMLLSHGASHNIWICQWHNLNNWISTCQALTVHNKPTFYSPLFRATTCRCHYG